MATVDHAMQDHSVFSDPEARVRALETVLVEKGYIRPEMLDRIVERFECQVGPHIGVRIVARAWSDPEFCQALLRDGRSTINAAGQWGTVSYQLIAVANTPQQHNLIVCTLCSCYPYDILGLPPSWYKSDAYRSRAVLEPRVVLTELGLQIAPDVDVRVLDSTADTRYLVIPMRPGGTEGWTEEQLSQLVTRDSMVGAARAREPSEIGHE